MFEWHAQAVAARNVERDNLSRNPLQVQRVITAESNLLAMQRPTDYRRVFPPRESRLWT